jgi:hypothetical protein
MIRAYLSYWHKDSKGKTIKYRRYRSDSFVGNILKIISYMFGNITYISQSDTVQVINIPTQYRLITTSGSTYQYMPAWVANPLEASAGDDTLGIVVGSGSTAVTLNDYNLVSKIPHGTTAGRLSYGASTVQDMNMSNPTLWTFNIIRTFTNNSGAPIDIREIGLIGTYLRISGTLLTTDKVMIARDALSTPITLQPNEQALIQYKINFRKAP